MLVLEDLRKRDFSSFLLESPCYTLKLNLNFF